MRRSWPGPQRKPCVGLHHRTGLLARRAADYASARAQRSATRCRRRRPRDGSIRRQRTMDPDSRRRTHGLRTLRSALVCPEGQTPFRTICPGLGQSFPGSWVGFRWVFLSRSRHTWVAGMSLERRVGMATGDAPSAIRGALRSQVHAFRRQDGRQARQLHSCIGVPPRIVMTFRGL